MTTSRLAHLDRSTRPPVLAIFVDETIRLYAQIEALKARLATQESPASPCDDVLRDVADLKAGLQQIRDEIESWYPDAGALALHLKVRGLGKERDMWKTRALRAEAANRDFTRQTAHDQQRNAKEEPATNTEPS